jgi:Tfp pilus assembly protein PilV
MVSMFVIAVGLLAMLPFQVRSAQTIGFAHERQQATALANRALEQVRGAAETPTRAQAIAAGGPAYGAITGWALPAGETLVTSTTPDTSLAQLGPTATAPAFTVRLYVTTRSSEPAGTVWVTSVADWSSSTTRVGRRQVVVRGLVYVGGTP